MSGCLDAPLHRAKQHLGDCAWIGPANRFAVPLDRHAQCLRVRRRLAEDRANEVDHEIPWRLVVMMKDKLEVGGFRQNVAH
jgi:hypothetical protein